MVTVNQVAKGLGVAFPAANRALIQLQDLGILESVKEQKRNRVFVARQVIDVLDRPTIPEMF